ncbi:hypothetical protein FBFR_12470 [Flavobacterium fryxellicola]|uniref:Uncharacterized protein n=2 Tax=Flavobacterium fryxellicola TaxID=249352 RepID=A0A167W181_9FLAO|nr:hypothetical protein FBFR_12470 [Flavobacterium fryxellicola]
MLCSITIVKAQSNINEAPSVSEMAGEMITKVKLAKEYFITTNDKVAGKTFEQRISNLTTKTKALFNEYRVVRTDLNRIGLFDTKDIKESINNELSAIRLTLHYMNLPTDL